MQLTELARPVSVSLSQSLFHAIQELESELGVSFAVDWDWIAIQNVHKDAYVHLLLRDIPLGRVIELMLYSASDVELSCLSDKHNGLLITTRQKALHFTTENPARYSFWRAELPSPVGSKVSPADITLQKLQSPITWVFENNMLWAVLDYIRNTIWRNFFIDWRRLSADGVTEDTRISGTGDPKPASEVLDSVLGTVSDNLAWRIDDFGIVIVSTREVIGRMFPAPDESGDTGADASE